MATVMQICEKTAAAHGDRPAMKVKRGGAWQTTTWREYIGLARKAAKSCIKLGLEPGHGVSIIGYNSPEWFIADIAAIYAGGVPAGIYTTNSPEQCHYIAEHCDANIAVVENAAQLAKFKEIRDRLPMLKAIVLIEGTDDDEGVLSWAEFLAAGDDVSDADLQARIDGQDEQDTCTLIYTSGTTGPPKAVMITHENVTWTAQTTMAQIAAGPTDVLVSYLPLSHIAEQMVSLHGPLNLGACTCFAESLDKLGENLREVRPTYFLAVPRVWEKIQAKMVATGANNSPLKKKIAAWARGVGLAAGFAEQEGRGKPMLHGLAKKLVFDKVRLALGLDRCKLQITSAAPISRDTLEFFLSLGIPIYEVYGMSECTGPATISLPGRYKTGKAGFCLPGAELKIAADGEVCMRGKHVFNGYLKNDDATAEALDDDGWLHSGDIGEIDDKGFLQITDRKKDLIITAGGENIAPQLIEGQLKSIPVVAAAVVIGDRRKFLSALLTLDPERLATDAKTAGSPATTVAEAAGCATFRAWLQTRIDGVNSKLARVQTIKRFEILDGEFSIEGGELTPTMKVKRKVVNSKYERQIEGMYSVGQSS